LGQALLSYYPLSGELSGSASRQSSTQLSYGLEEGPAAGDRSGIQLARHTIHTRAEVREPDNGTEAKLHHAGIVSCRKIIKAEATNKEAEEEVLAGERKLIKECQPICLPAKEVGARYGMSLCHSSPIVREVWDKADRHLWKLMVAHLPCYSPSPY